MRPAIAILCSLLLAGCASKPPSPPAPAAVESFPSLPGMTTNGVLLSAFSILPSTLPPPPPPPVPVVLPPIIYPPDASNHIWYLQESPDLLSWTNYAGPFSGQPGGEFVLSNTASPSFWRMEADQ
ncbi:MAG: hypothetical protein ABSG59_18245 [Verrucomicrobiota bacterium]|jgi:hypothetical protein